MANHPSMNCRNWGSRLKLGAGFYALSDIPVLTAMAISYDGSDWIDGIF